MNEYLPRLMPAHFSHPPETAKAAQVSPVFLSRSLQSRLPQELQLSFWTYFSLDEKFMAVETVAPDREIPS